MTEAETTGQKSRNSDLRAQLPLTIFYFHT